MKVFVATRSHMTPPSLPSPTRLTPLQVLPLSASPNKLPALSETVSQETSPKTGAEAGFKPRHSGSRVHACNQHSEIVTVNVDSIGVSPASTASTDRRCLEICWISSTFPYLWGLSAMLTTNPFMSFYLGLFFDGQRLLENSTFLPRMLSPRSPNTLNLQGTEAPNHCLRLHHSRTTLCHLDPEEALS